jgi:hypothetical protein
MQREIEAAIASLLGVQGRDFFEFRSAYAVRCIIVNHSAAMRAAANVRVRENARVY